jgi:hypothetical protein
MAVLVVGGLLPVGRGGRAGCRGRLAVAVVRGAVVAVVRGAVAVRPVGDLAEACPERAPVMAVVMPAAHAKGTQQILQRVVELVDLAHRGALIDGGPEQIEDALDAAEQLAVQAGALRLGGRRPRQREQQKAGTHQRRPEDAAPAAHTVHD